jgi:hypothetical protein
MNNVTIGFGSPAPADWAKALEIKNIGKVPIGV